MMDRLERRSGSRTPTEDKQWIIEISAYSASPLASGEPDARGGAYYRKKLAEGKSRKEALRCLKRRISDADFRSLMADSQVPLRGVA